jgi:hypothetical protein
MWITKPGVVGNLSLYGWKLGDNGWKLGTFGWKLG